MSKVAIRPLRAGDVDAVVALMRATLGTDAPSEARLTRDFLLDPGFEAHDLPVAEADGDLVGYTLLSRIRPPTPVDDPSAYRTGWIVAFGVRVDWRRQAVASALLERAMEGFGAADVRRVDVADVPVRYLVPGIDPAAHPEAHALLVDRFGFTVRDEVASMGRPLEDLPAPVDAGIAIRPLDPAEIPLVRDWLVEEHGWSWWLHVSRSLGLQLAGDPTPALVLVAWDRGRPLGIAHFRAERFGPLAVAAEARGRGIGSALTLNALARMRERGLARAYFLIGRPQVQRFYARLGFGVLRRFSRLRRDLPGSPRDPQTDQSTSSRTQ